MKNKSIFQTKAKKHAALLTHTKNTDYVAEVLANHFELERKLKKLNILELKQFNQYSVEELNAENISFINNGEKYMCKFDSSDRLLEVYDMPDFKMPELIGRRKYNKKGELIYSYHDGQTMGPNEYRFIDLYNKRDAQAIRDILLPRFKELSYEDTEAYMFDVCIANEINQIQFRQIQVRGEKYEFELFWNYWALDIKYMSKIDHRKKDFKYNFTKENIIELLIK